MSSAAGGLTVPGLDGAAVIVTGGGSGIGAATARQLGLAGAAVVLVGRRPDCSTRSPRRMGGDRRGKRAGREGGAAGQ